MGNLKRKLCDVCPLCSGKVDKFVINFGASVEMCQKDSCPYPFDNNMISKDFIIINESDSLNSRYANANNKLASVSNPVVATAESDNSNRSAKRARKSPSPTSSGTSKQDEKTSDQNEIDSFNALSPPMVTPELLPSYYSDSEVVAAGVLSPGPLFYNASPTGLGSFPCTPLKSNALPSGLALPPASAGVPKKLALPRSSTPVSPKSKQPTGFAPPPMAKKSSSSVSAATGVAVPPLAENSTSSTSARTDLSSSNIENLLSDDNNQFFNKFFM